MNIFEENYKVKILCVGVGENASCLVSDLSKKGFASIDFIAINADKEFSETNELKCTSINTYKLIDYITKEN